MGQWVEVYVCLRADNRDIQDIVASYLVVSRVKMSPSLHRMLALANFLLDDGEAPTLCLSHLGL